ncbi:MAG: SPFH/Band 7/PHB domain protein, partial [Firmicutes bacterium]|nr:SPFH/Band 7/PHB domain protein [Bacillota bacterium]
FGAKALIINWLGKSKKVSLAIEQNYLRSLPVNSEEGAPLGIGLWYEMYINDPVAYLFRNSNPRGSLAANVSNSTVKCLSNMPLSDLMIQRHEMSRPVRKEVSEKSEEWGYKLGSCYIRKVHFRDHNMILQIQNKVVNRLRQVTAAILQDGANQVNVITSAAEKTAAVDFGRAASIRPQIVGAMLKEVSTDKTVCDAFFECLEVKRIVDNNIPINIMTEKLSLMLPSNTKKIHTKKK